ncbi:hypothetical protein [Sanguibacter massiliensis]|nr:hypothetical protein [Sanguibacter massiliensis]
MALRSRRALAIAIASALALGPRASGTTTAAVPDLPGPAAVVVT